MQVEIINFEETRVAVLEHRGPANRISDSVAIFTAWRQASGLSPVQTSRTFGVAYDNPHTTPPAQYRFDICSTVDAPVPANPYQVINKVMPANRCAVIRDLPSHEQLDAAIEHLFGLWLPSSGEALSDFPLFFEYRKLGPDFQESERLTDVYLPLK
jgi:AraC family transcriptional regulator